jgi:hypothetical protein
VGRPSVRGGGLSGWCRARRRRGSARRGAGARRQGSFGGSLRWCWLAAVAVVETPWAGAGHVSTIAAMGIVVACWRAALRRSWRPALAVALLGGLLGAVALAALAGARSTAGAYGRYLKAINVSDVQVNVPWALPGIPLMTPIERVWSLPGVVSHATYLGLNALPVMHGKIDDSFLTNNIEGSVDGAGFTQDAVTVVAGALPPLESTTGVVVTPRIAQAFGAGVGGQVTYAFLSGSQAHPAVQYRSYRVAAIVLLPPALTDQYDTVEGTLLPPGATRELIGRYYGYAWVGLRLTAGPAGVHALQARLSALVAGLVAESARASRDAPGSGGPDLALSVKHTDGVHEQVQRAIMPEVVVLVIFGVIAGLATLVLAGLGLAQLMARAAPDPAIMRAIGASRGQAAIAAGLPGLIAVAGATVLAATGAFLLSPLAPVGPVRFFDPAKGFKADPLVLGAGAPALLALLLAVLAALAARFARPRGSRLAGQGAGAVPPGGRGASRAAAAAGLPAAAVVGVRNTLSGGLASGPARSALGGAVVAVTAMVTAVVFGGSLTGLATHPARYGWNWDVLVQSEGSWGLFKPGPAGTDAMDKLVGGQPGVAGWSELAFAQLPVDGGRAVVPVVGLRRHPGPPVEPPTTSGHPLDGSDQIELGTVTLRELGKKIGDTITIGIPRYARKVTIVGTVTLPSIGVVLADHPSLGHGAMLPEDTLLAVTLGPAGSLATGMAQPVLPSIAVIDLVPGTTAAQRAALVSRIVSANPDGTPGGTYELPPLLASSVLNAQQLGGQPLALAVGLAVAALLSIAMTILTAVRRRRREFALLKALGMTRGQVLAAVTSHASLTLVIAVAAGGPLGVIAGRLAWRGFAGSLGVVPFTEIPLLTIVAGLAALIAAGNLLACAPGAVAARTRPGAILRAE